MNMNELAREVARQEGKTKQLNLGQIKEVLGIVAREVAQDPITLANFLKLGAKKKVVRGKYGSRKKAAK